MAFILISMLFFALAHSLLASRRIKRAVIDRIGDRAYQGFYRLSYNIFAAITLGPILLVVYLDPGAVVWRLPEPWHLVGLGIQVAGVVLLALALGQIDLMRFLGLRQVRAYLNGDPLPLPPEKMQTGGVYGVVRHPLYLASMLVLWPLTPMRELMLAFNIAATVYFAIGSWYEERRMVQTFGQQYMTYKSRVPWLIPLPRSRQDV